MLRSAIKIDFSSSLSTFCFTFYFYFYLSLSHHFSIISDPLFYHSNQLILLVTRIVWYWCTTSRADLHSQLLNHTGKYWLSLRTCFWTYKVDSGVHNFYFCFWCKVLPLTAITSLLLHHRHGYGELYRGAWDDVLLSRNIYKFSTYQLLPTKSRNYYNKIVIKLISLSLHFVSLCLSLSLCVIREHYLTNAEPFEPEEFPVLLVGNKCDLSDRRAVTLEEVMDWCAVKRPRRPITYIGITASPSCHSVLFLCHPHLSHYVYRTSLVFISYSLFLITFYSPSLLPSLPPFPSPWLSSFPPPAPPVNF